MTPISEDKKNSARKLRIEEKKSFPEIARILGISKSTVHNWARDEGWPDPQKERRELGRILKATHAPKPKQAPEKSPANKSPKAPAPMSPFSLLADPFDPIDPGTLSEPVEKMVETLFRFSSKVVAEAARWDVKTAVKLMETSSRILVAVRVPTPPKDGPRFLVSLTPIGETPPTQETYRDPPPGFKPGEPQKSDASASEAPDINEPKAQKPPPEPSPDQDSGDLPEKSPDEEDDE